MKWFVLFVKIVLLFVLWVVAAAFLHYNIKSHFIEIDAPYQFRAVMWMHVPMTLIMAYTLFGKKFINIVRVNHFVEKLERFFSKIIVGRVFLFIIFSVLTFFSAFEIMWGYNLIRISTVVTVEDSLSLLSLIGAGILRMCVGLVGCWFSNIYYKS